jgi:atypical dual specificity phosphatase
MSNLVGWVWDSVKYYAQTSWYLAYVYGRVRSLVQPYVPSSDFNVSLIEDRVYIGDIAAAFNREKLKELGVTHIITAVLGVDPQFPDDFKYMNVPVRDVHNEDIKQFLSTTTKFIEDALYENGQNKVLVHCVCGVSRSATIVAAWMMSKHGYSVDETISILQSKRECVNPIPAFREQLEAK